MDYFTIKLFGWQMAKKAIKLEIQQNERRIKT